MKGSLTGVSRFVDIDRAAALTAEMSDQVAGADDAVHVFDQTNGVLGADDEPDRKARSDAASPAALGVPPIVSL